MIFEVYLIKNQKPIEEELFNRLINLIHPEKRKRILKQKTKQSADNMLIGDVLAKVAIKKNFGINISEQKFEYCKYGKPYLLNHPEVHFNISHSGEFVVCGISDKPVGVDIQKISEYNFKIAQKVCNEKEFKQIENSIDKSDEFTKIWTQKEAVLKRIGSGILNDNIKNCLSGVLVDTEKIDDYYLSVCR